MISFSANDWGARAFAERLAGRARLEFGLDVNGRFDLRALEIRQTYTPSGTLATSTESSRSIRRTAWTTVSTRASTRRWPRG